MSSALAGIKKALKVLSVDEAGAEKRVAIAQGEEVSHRELNISHRLSLKAHACTHMYNFTHAKKEKKKKTLENFMRQKLHFNLYMAKFASY